MRVATWFQFKDSKKPADFDTKQCEAFHLSLNLFIIFIIGILKVSRRKGANPLLGSASHDGNCKSGLFFSPQNYFIKGKVKLKLQEPVFSLLSSSIKVFPRLDWG